MPAIVGDLGFGIADCGLRIADWGLGIADCGLRIGDCGLGIADWGLEIGDCGFRIADWGLWFTRLLSTFRPLGVWIGYDYVRRYPAARS
ncbi:MAG: hypothetical protein WBF93_00045, partial [Pirellulales bacterium]